MTSRERDSKIESYGNAYSKLVAALERFPEEVWQWRDEHGCWSIHEHVIHIADSEVNSYVRCRRLIAQPGESLQAYDENGWANALDYHSQSVDEALELFRSLRSTSYHLIRSLPEHTWTNKAYHPENGDMTLDDWLDTYERHVAEHISFMQENFEAWSARP